MWRTARDESPVRTLGFWYSPTRGEMKITIAHSPDSDDAFMFYALATEKIDPGRIPNYS